MTSSPGIRAATPDDHPVVDAMLIAAGLPPEGLDDHRADLLVLTAAERLVGAIGAERYGEHALVRSLVVVSDERGHGRGSRLLGAQLDRLASLGVTDTWLLTTDATVWFAARGFEPVPRDRAPDALQASAQLRGACCASAALMTRPLDR